MIYVEAPNTSENPQSLFLAGSISNCPDWQQDLIGMISDMNITVFNPRRKNFPIHDPNAAASQITWEYQHLRKATMISFWFCKETMGPIVLYELGAWAMTRKPIVIGMDPEYPRRLDVEIQIGLARPDVHIVYSLKDLSNFIRYHGVWPCQSPILP